MSFEEFESSRAGGLPVELYEFRYGEGADEIFRFTSADHDLEVGGETYASAYVERDGITDDGNPDDGDGIAIQLAWDNPLGELYRVQPFERTVIARIKVTHLDDPAAQVLSVWSGRVTEIAWEYPRMRLGCERIATSLKRTGVRAKYQRQCRHVLYQVGCRLDREDWHIAVEVTAVEGRLATLRYLTWGPQVPTETVEVEGEEVEVLDLPGNWFLGGMLVIDGITRVILAQAPYSPETGEEDPADVVVTLSRPLADLQEAVSAETPPEVRIYPGCDRTHATCRDRFANHLNYGGFDYIPIKGPFEGNSLI